MMGPWVCTVIGRPYQEGSAGPEAYDCWGLVRTYYRDVRHMELPVVDVDVSRLMNVVTSMQHHDEVARWEKVGIAEEGCVAVMTQSRQPHHVGIWIGGGVLHAIARVGVVWQRELDLRKLGWRVLGFYRRRV